MQSFPPRSVEEARADVLKQARTSSRSETIGLEDALGRVLAEPIHSDLDLPPFDKALVDGYALRLADSHPPLTEFRLIGEVLAGQEFAGEVREGEAVSIMTGAPLPRGADSVVMLEKSECVEGRVRVKVPAKPGQNRILRGREMKLGEPLFFPGTRLNAARLGVIASVGRKKIQVVERPQVSIVATGDELVEIDSVPGPAQIRNSNSTLLAALVTSLGAEPTVFPIAPDESIGLKKRLSDALQGAPGQNRPADFLLISGGVSAGKRDLVPSTLEALGVKNIFHKVHVKPGKPLWFGVTERSDGNEPTLVFGLPGNPVSGIISTLLFVAPALAVFSGMDADSLSTVLAPLHRDFRWTEDRPTYFPASRTQVGAVDPLPWGGSSDLKTIALSDGFILLTPGQHECRAGDLVSFLAFP